MDDTQSSHAVLLNSNTTVISFAFVAALPFSSSNVAAGTAVQRPSFREGQYEAEYHENQSDPEYHKRSYANAANSTLIPLVSVCTANLVGAHPQRRIGHAVRSKISTSSPC